MGMNSPRRMYVRRTGMILLFSLTGCTQPVKDSRTQGQAAATTSSGPASPASSPTLPSMPPEISKALATQYKIAPLDLIQVTIYMEPDLSRTVRVSSNGTINYPLIGETQAAGMTPFDLEKQMTEKLGKFVINPNVSIDLKELHSRRVSILGEVAKPGLYDIPGDKGLSVVEAIATAGGFTKFASPNGTRVVRTENGKQQNITVPVNDITKGQTDKDISLQPDDVVFVPQTIF